VIPFGGVTAHAFARKPYIDICLACNNWGTLNDVLSPDNPLESRFPVVRRLRREAGESLVGRERHALAALAMLWDKQCIACPNIFT
jgi:hypothetical protein